MRERAAVHAQASSRLGAAHPRREAPPDLRLVPPALAAWATAALGSGLRPGTAAVAAAVAAVAAVALLPLRRAGATAVATALLCASAAGAVTAAHTTDLYRGPLPALAARHSRMTVELRVTDDPRPARPRTRGAVRAPDTVIVEAEAVRVTADGATTAVRTPVLLFAEPPVAPWLRLLPSTRITVAARAAPPSEPGGGVAAVLQVRGPPRITAGPSTSQRIAGRLRAGLRAATDGLSPDTRALLPGLVVGDTSRITPDLRDAFRATDLTHLTAVSGSNLTLVLALLIGPPGLAIRAERRGLAPRLGMSLRTTAFLGAVLTGGFVVVCRPDPSVLRAAACGLVTLLAIGTGRRRSLLPALAAAVLLLVLYDPWLAGSYGFVLSVLATGALLTLAPGWSEALRRRRVPPRIAEALASAGAAQAVCAPVVVVLAGHVSLVAVPCNLLAEIAVGPATVLGFAALGVAPLSMPAARAVAWVAGLPTGWIVTVARRGGALPGAAVGWPGSWPGAVLLAALVVAVVPLGRRLLHHPWWCAAVALLLVVAVLRPPPLPRILAGRPPHGWLLAMCDVGQGDALALSAGAGAAVVIDAGPDPESVDRCLRVLGVVSVPLVILTHFHADHVDGLPGVLRGRTIGAIETTTLDEPPGQVEFVRRQAAGAGVPVIRAAAGERRRLGPLQWRVLWPPAQPSLLPDDGPNDASVTLLVATAGLTLLLLGDLEPAAQRQLLAAVPDLPQVDVLKVAHHGSSYQDPELLARARPRLALISVGAGNPYGHPSPRTVDTLRGEGAAVLRTDTDGAVAVTGDGPDTLRATVIRGP